jgi:uncharacterized protein
MKRFVLTATVSLTAAFVAASFAVAADAPTAKSAQQRTVKVLVLTGNEYPGHKWRETAPFFTQFLMADPRMAVDVNTDPDFLASPDLFKYDAIVLNYLNWKCPDPGEKARASLKKFVEGGRGLVVVHNAVAAFGDWPEIKEIFGRAWNPKRTHGHDPYGTFTVKIVDAEHPITRGLKTFETTDELYTCLYSSGRPIHVLATAMSKVEKKEHPMAFVNRYGRGRVFVCVLGHDVKSLVGKDVQELYRRGTAWAAGIPPVAAK